MDQIINIAKGLGIVVHSLPDGEYLTLYHGTSPKSHKDILKSGKFKEGTFFAKDYATARRYGLMKIGRGEPVVMQVHIHVKDLAYNGYFYLRGSEVKELMSPKSFYKSL